MRACAHWPNDAQIDLTVVVVIVGVVVVVVICGAFDNLNFVYGQTYGHTDLRICGHTYRYTVLLIELFCS